MFLVTGSGGFIGSCLIAELSGLYKESTIVALDKVARRYPRRSGAKIISLKADLLDRKSLEEIPKGIKTVFHLAAFVPRKKEEHSSSKNICSNIEGMHNLLSVLCKRKSINKVIYSSSISVYGSAANGKISEEDRPAADSFYGESKLCAERILELFFNAYGFNAVILRYSSVYGPGQSGNTVLPLFIENALKGREIVLYGSGRRFMDFVYVKDVVSANILAARYRGSGIFNIGSGRPTSMKELATAVLDIFGKPESRVKYYNGEDVSPSVYLDIGLAGNKMGYKPRFMLKAGLRDLRKELARS